MQHGSCSFVLLRLCHLDVTYALLGAILSQCIHPLGAEQSLADVDIPDIVSHRTSVGEHQTSQRPRTHVAILNLPQRMALGHPKWVL
eukprot:1241654-Amphidinium_carterae.1